MKCYELSFADKNQLIKYLIHCLERTSDRTFWEPDRSFQDGGQENQRAVGTYFITISSVY